MLTGVMTLAICNLLATINEVNPQDYVYAAMFMISTTCFLKIQWLLGTAFMSLPLLVTHLWHKNSNVLPTDAMVHLTVSWAVGGFMSYLSDTYRRWEPQLLHALWLLLSRTLSVACVTSRIRWLIYLGCLWRRHGAVLHAEACSCCHVANCISRCICVKVYCTFPSVGVLAGLRSLLLSIAWSLTYMSSMVMTCVWLAVCVCTRQTCRPVLTCCCTL